MVSLSRSAGRRLFTASDERVRVPADDDALAQLAQQAEDAVRARGLAEVPSDEVTSPSFGLLRELDEVAYLRFASVYNAFSSIDDFEKRF